MTPVTSLANPADVTAKFDSNWRHLSLRNQSHDDSFPPGSAVVDILFHQKSIRNGHSTDGAADYFDSFQVTKLLFKKKGFGSKRNQMALRRRFSYRIQAFSVELSTIIPKVTVSSLHLSPIFIEFQANQLKIHKNDKILCAILF